MKIEKLTDNTYRVRKQYKGRTYAICFDHKPTQKEAMIRMTEKMQVETDGSKGKFEEYADKYIRSKENVLSPSTIGGYRKIIRCLSAEFKAKQLFDIQQIDIQNEINRYAVDHAPKSVRNLHGFISAVFAVFRPNMNISTTLP